MSVDATIAKLVEALEPFAQQKKIDELMAAGGDVAWQFATVQDRVRLMGERKREKTANILRARAVLAGIIKASLP